MKAMKYLLFELPLFFDMKWAVYKEWNYWQSYQDYKIVQLSSNWMIWWDRWLLLVGPNFNL